MRNDGDPDSLSTGVSNICGAAGFSREGRSIVPDLRHELAGRAGGVAPGCRARGRSGARQASRIVSRCADALGPEHLVTVSVAKE